MSFAMRAFAAQGKQLLARPTRRALLQQQRREMSGGDDDDHLRVNWWDAPTDPDSWKRYQLAWAAFGFWGVVFGGVYASKSGAKPAEAK